MSTTLARTPSPDNSRPSKKAKLVFDDTAFYTGVLSPEYAVNLRQTYMFSNPFKHCVISRLFDVALLENVQKEVVSQLSFTEKETDIYKVHQTGDLASLSYISASELSLLPSLLRLRNAMYSAPFRKLMRNVTGCGPLSGTKQDMSVNSYRKGCHLLNHDDVIGTRRVSYILYMPIGENNGHEWKPEWGGALELYPVHEVNGILQPKVKPTLTIPPSWNQFTFFEVQPGHSFHSVEEVIIDTGADGIQRLSISGWFHAAQEGEEDYDPSDLGNKTKNSSLNQLSSPSKSDCLTQYENEFKEVLNSRAIAELAPFLNPVYLQTKTIKSLQEKFAEDSSIELHQFLRDDLATQLSTLLLEADASDGLGPRGQLIPSHDCGTISKDWLVKGPPHKLRYCIPNSSVTPSRGLPSVLLGLEQALFRSNGFRTWLCLLTTLVPLAHDVEARRFRPGLDYTLARANEYESRLDVVLGLTPNASSTSGTENWDAGNIGGWECYMAPHLGEDDPAVYRTGSKPKTSHDSASLDSEVNPQNAITNITDEDEDDTDDEGTLLSVHAGFNRLLLVLRDEHVMRFVKYVSASAPGSRWDVCGEYSVGTAESDDSDRA